MFSFDIPDSLIAQKPRSERDKSRLLVLYRDGSIEHRQFDKIADYLKAGDALVLNDTKVIPVRLKCAKQNGDTIEILLTKKLQKNNYEIMSKGSFSGTAALENGINAQIKQGSEVTFDYTGDIEDTLEEIGMTPLPPYIKREADKEDAHKYQTVYARAKGSIAAPTAGLHFTEALINKIKNKGVNILTITLHIGIGTFKPIRVYNIEEHKMDQEFFEIDSAALEKIQKTKNLGSRVFLVGTSTTRALEAYIKGKFMKWENSNGKIRGFADLFIRPGYDFKAADCIITNFHQPNSTPLLLACAKAGTEKLINAYKEAIAVKYRFYSYGDAMLIL
ncbi:s-adenosylmethionine/tRNA-ribosyltransferase-isomerase [Candidatus Magnetoovum chiemensis]|nr:s-adenosylmethionine/tRNA-ribosyltransferase-isomerase [Candidatus Magnetoovum chiemensis]